MDCVLLYQCKRVVQSDLRTRTSGDTQTCSVGSLTIPVSKKEKPALNRHLSYLTSSTRVRYKRISPAEFSLAVPQRQTRASLKSLSSASGTQPRYHTCRLQSYRPAVWVLGHIPRRATAQISRDGEGERQKTAPLPGKSGGGNPRRRSSPPTEAPVQLSPKDIFFAVAKLSA